MRNSKTKRRTLGILGFLGFFMVMVGVDTVDADLHPHSFLQGGILALVGVIIVVAVVVFLPRLPHN